MWCDDRILCRYFFNAYLRSTKNVQERESKVAKYTVVLLSVRCIIVVRWNLKKCKETGVAAAIWKIECKYALVKLEQEKRGKWKQWETSMKLVTLFSTLRSSSSFLRVCGVKKSVWYQAPCCNNILECIMHLLGAAWVLLPVLLSCSFPSLVKLRQHLVRRHGSFLVQLTRSVGSVFCEVSFSVWLSCTRFSRCAHISHNLKLTASTEQKRIFFIYCTRRIFLSF